MSFVEPVTLRGTHAWIEPLAESHLDALKVAAADGELWNLWFTSVPAPDEAKANIEFRLGERARGTMMPFVIHRMVDDQIVGATTFCNIDNKAKRLEIGYTWYAQSVQRTAINTEVKLLLLTHAFEKLSVIAVEFRTHHANEKSRAAILRLGAKHDGVLRSHGIDRRGSLRDTYVYSIIAAEWPDVKRGLQQRLTRC
jgi:RimJ/RimL family protein N-acetyltransferase